MTFTPLNLSETFNAAAAPVALVKLADSAFTIANPSEDIRDRPAYNRRGERIGHIDDLYLDEQAMRLRFLRVAAGGFLGLGATHFLVPVEAIVAVLPDGVHIDQTRELEAGSPMYDPVLTRRRYRDELALHATAPSWATTHAPPPLLPERNPNLPDVPATLR